MKTALLCVLLSLALLSARTFAEETPVAAEPTTETTPADSAENTATEEPSKSSSLFTEEQLASMKGKEETFEFQAEVNRLMDIIINSLYTNREIFIREIISNAADALDKIRFQSLTDKSVLGEGETAQLDIKIKLDKDAKTITITDRGVGMTKEGLKKNLGVVAHSGTTEFVEAVAKGGDKAMSLIGQFGVGFYSVYLVADKVTVISKHNDDAQYIWESTAQSTYSITEDPRGNTLGRGTSITLHLKPDAEEFLNEHTLEKLVTRYSQFINFPIYLWTTKSVEEEVPVEEEPAKEEAAEPKEGEELDVSEEEEEDASKTEEETKPKTTKVKKDVSDWERVNNAKAIWTRNPKEVTEEEYVEFYKDLTKDSSSEEPLTKIHFSAEGEISFKALMYVPPKAEHGMYDRFYEKSTSVKLYVRKVLISDTFEDFLPRYLNFVKGVVDSDDLPLNVNREQLAQNKVLKVMGKKLTRKVLDMLRKLAQGEKKKDEEEEPKEGEEVTEKEAKQDKYLTFWENFGKSIKLGLIDDRANKNKLSKLLRFVSSKSEGKFISLDDYVERMKEDQKYIYFLTGESLAAVEKSPFIEKLKKRDLEVLFMVDPLDEYVSQSLTEFDGKQLQSVTKEGLKLGDEDEAREKKLQEQYKDLTTWLKGLYGDKVEKVVVSNRIATTPCILVSGQYGWTANMERIMRAQTFSDADKQTYMHARKVMEINPRHPIIKELAAKQSADSSDKALEDLANLMYDAALLQSGFSMKDPSDFAARIHRVVSLGLDISPNAEIEEEEEPTPKTEETEDEEEEEVETEAETPAETETESEAEKTEEAPAEEAAATEETSKDEL